MRAPRGGHAALMLTVWSGAYCARAASPTVAHRPTHPALCSGVGSCQGVRRCLDCTACGRTPSSSHVLLPPAPPSTNWLTLPGWFWGLFATAVALCGGGAVVGKKTRQQKRDALPNCPLAHRHYRLVRLLTVLIILSFIIKRILNRP